MYHLTAHLRLNAIYWGLTALCIMRHKDALDRAEMVDFVLSCWDDEAGLSRRVRPADRALTAVRRRCLWAPPRPRRACARDAERDTDPHHPGRAGQGRRRSRDEVCVSATSLLSST